MQASARIRIPVEGKISLCTRVYRLKIVGQRIYARTCTHFSAQCHVAHFGGNATKIKDRVFLEISMSLLNKGMLYSPYLTLLHS